MAFDFATAAPVKKRKFEFSEAAPAEQEAAAAAPARAPRPTAHPIVRAAQNLAVRGAKAFTLPFENPVARQLESAGEEVATAAGSVGKNLVRRSGGGLNAPLVAGSIIEGVSDIGKLTPKNIATNMGAELGGRVIAGPVAKLAGSAAKKGLSSLTGVSEEAITAALKNPKVLDASMEGAARELPEAAQKFRQAIGHLTEEARSKLSTSRFIVATSGDAGGAFTKDEVLGAIKGARKKIGAVLVPEQEAAVKVLSRVENNLNKIRNTVSQNQVHNQIRDLDSAIPWDRIRRKPETMTKTDEALMKARGILDGMLKNKNEAYRTEIEKVSELIRGRKEFQNKFHINKVGSEYLASDQTTNALGGALKEGKIDTERVVGLTKKLIGEDLMPKVRDAAAGAEMRKAGSVGKFAALGLGAGGAAGTVMAGPAGGFLGAGGGVLAGGTLDKYAPKLMGDLVRLTVKGKTVLIPLQYIPIMPSLRAIPKVTQDTRDE